MIDARRIFAVEPSPSRRRESRALPSRWMLPAVVASIAFALALCGRHRASAPVVDARAEFVAVAEAAILDAGGSVYVEGPAREVQYSVGGHRYRGAGATTLDAKADALREWRAAR